MTSNEDLTAFETEQTEQDIPMGEDLINSETPVFNDENEQINKFADEFIDEETSRIFEENPGKFEDKSLDTDNLDGFETVSVTDDDAVGQYAVEFLDSSSEGTDRAAGAVDVVEGAEAENKRLRDEALKAYGQQVKQTMEDKLIIEYLPLVHKIVQQVISYLRPPLSKEDLISAGTIGLVKAARDFDPGKDAEFKTYAYIRVRGAVIDELRGWSFTPASARKQFNQAMQLAEQMEEQSGKVPTDAELARELGMSEQKMYRMFENARAKHFLSIHGVSDEEPALGSLLAVDTDQPGDNLDREELIEKLADAISSLPKRKRRIVVLYYNKGLTMKQIADLMNITESRVSQLHASALFKLSVKLKRYE